MKIKLIQADSVEVFLNVSYVGIFKDRKKKSIKNDEFYECVSMYIDNIEYPFDIFCLDMIYQEMLYQRLEKIFSENYRLLIIDLTKTYGEKTTKSMILSYKNKNEIEDE